MRGAVPAGYAAGIVWGATLMLCVSIVPLHSMRDLAIEQEAAERANYDADLARLPADAPLWAWAPFLKTRDETKRGAVLDRICRLDRRQSDAAIMLERGDFPLLYLGSLD